VRKTANDADSVLENKSKDFDDPMLRPDEWGKELDKFEPMIGKQKLNSELCRKMALTSPLFCKGVWKKSMDTFRAGVFINKEGNEPKGMQKVWIDSFNKRNNIYSLLKSMKICNHIYGFAPVYIRYAEEISSNEIKHDSPVEDAYEPFKIYLLDPEKVKKFEYKNKYWKNRGVHHLLYITSSGKEVYIHPDRFRLVSEKKLPFSMFGISDVAILRHIIDSNADIDVAMGKILKWFGYGKIEWRKVGADKDDKQWMKKVMENHPDVITSDMDYELKVHNPEAIDPKPFYDYITMCIAAVLIMPTHILTGVRVGRVTGAEAGYSDYHKDISDVQALVYTPFLTELYQMIFTANSTGKNKYIFDYTLEWNPTYVNEMAEAELMIKRADVVEKLLGKNHGPIIELDEAREIMKRGFIKFDKEASSLDLPKFSPKDEMKNLHDSFANLEMKKSQLTKLKEELNDRNTD